MSQVSKNVAAIDIGTTKIVAIIGRANSKGRIEIMGIGNVPSKGVKRGVVLNIEETSNSIRQAVKKAEEQAGVEVSNVFVGIAGQHIRSIKNRGYKYIDNQEHEIQQADVDALTHEMYKVPLGEGNEVIHVIPQSYMVDSETDIDNPVGMFGKRLDGNFHLVVGHVASAKNVVRCVERAGFHVIKLILEPLASAEAVLNNDEKEAGVALVDIGGGTTDISVFYDGVLRHTAVIPYGGYIVTQDIRKGCGILQRHAEQLKIQYGSALSDLAPENKVVTIPSIIGQEAKEITFKSLAHIIQARMAEVLAAINYELENSGYASSLSAGVVLTGGGSLLKNLVHLVNYELSMDARIGSPNCTYSGESDMEVAAPIYSTSVGLMMKGVSFYEESEEEDEYMEEDEEKEFSGNIRNKGKRIFKRLNNVFADLFDDRDTEMQ